MQGRERQVTELYGMEKVFMQAVKHKNWNVPSQNTFIFLHFFLLFFTLQAGSPIPTARLAQELAPHSTAYVQNCQSKKWALPGNRTPNA